MSQMTPSQMIVALDIGTSKVVCLVGQIHPGDQSLEIIGVGMKPARGMRKGVVVNIDEMTACIRGAVSEAELMADCSIHAAFVGMSGSHVAGINARAVVAIRDGEVTESDIERVVDAAKSGVNTNDHRILHVLPQEFAVDDQLDVRSPLGMAGVRLEGHIHVVTCAANAALNLEKCVHGAGLDLDGMVLQQLAASHAVLTEDEKELGVCVVDIGGGTTDIAVFLRGAIRHTAVIPVAGDQVTNDIAMALRTPTPAANDIKTRFACVVPQMVNPEQTVSVPGMGDRPERTLARQTLAAVVEPRYEELFGLIVQELDRAGLTDHLAAGVVLTGGSAKIEGAVQLAESIFHLPVRIGMPKTLKVGGMDELLRNPIYSSGIGLLLYGKTQSAQSMTGRPARSLWRATSNGSGFVDKVKNWLTNSF